jgi:hypothetical protein
MAPNPAKPQKKMPRMMRGIVCTTRHTVNTLYRTHALRPVRTVEEDVWLVSFMDYDMAYFDMESHKVSALENPFGPKVLG